MPELPEVETIARQLQGVLPGRTIQSVQVLREKSFKGQVYQLIGQSVNQVTRKAKNIIIELDNNLVMLIHLKMTGQLIFQPAKTTPEVKSAYTSGVNGGRIVGGHPTSDWVNELPSKHTRVIIKFKDKSTLFFNDMRVFGWVKIIQNSKLKTQIESMPPDVIDKEFTVKYLEKVLKKSARPVKLVLLDQAKIGGLGNIYVNDALCLAHTKPTRKANSLQNAEIKELHKASIRVIRRGIETGGASESTYKHINGMGGKYQEEFLVYKRVGERCGLNNCDGVIEKIKLGGRGTFFCPKHQH